MTPGTSPIRSPIVLATANPHKVEEMRAIFGAAGIEVVSLADIPGGKELREPIEHGDTFEANSTIKAVSYAGAVSALVGEPRLCLADDSGIEIDALRAGPSAPPRPGVISSHYCTDGREVGMSRGERDLANNERVLRELTGAPWEKRTARFVCVMTLADASGRVLAQSRGTFEGRIGEPPRVPSGGNGFGYDPLFLVAPELAKTGAELSSDEKNRLSHRARAAEGMVAKLRSLPL